MKNKPTAAQCISMASFQAEIFNGQVKALHGIPFTPSLANEYNTIVKNTAAFIDELSKPIADALVGYGQKASKQQIEQVKRIFFAAMMKTEAGSINLEILEKLQQFIRDAWPHNQDDDFTRAVREIGSFCLWD